MKLDVLVSAMNLKNYMYINSLNITGDCIVINQCENNRKQIIEEKERRICYVETTERGLSKSRNMAIQHATNEICVLCDNDVEYVEGYEDIILNTFRENPSYDIIVFHVTSDMSPSPTYSRNKRLGYLSCCKAFSCEIAFRRSRVANIHFNERIGAGTRFKMGEENVFLYDCLRSNLQIHFVPKKIACLRDEPTTWDTGFDKNYMLSRGASYMAMTKCFSYFWMFQFAIRKYKLYRSNLSFWQALKYMKLGGQQYKNVIGNK